MSIIENVSLWVRSHTSFLALHPRVGVLMSVDWFPRPWNREPECCFPKKRNSSGCC